MAGDVLTVGSLFTGVGGIDLGLERAGMRIAWQCEIDPWCRRVLARHWPGVPCIEDVRDVTGRDGLRRDRGLPAAAEGRERPAPAAAVQPVDLLCGGVPCQDWSVAGKRAGLGGERSGLFFEFARVADELVRPGGWILFENVPGLLSACSCPRCAERRRVSERHRGADFYVVLSTLYNIGFRDLAARVVDSRYFGVPQRRRRVLVVGRRAAGDGARQVLLEPESGGGNFAARRQTGPRAAASLSRGSASPGVSAPGRRQEDDENIVSAVTGSQRFGVDDNRAQAGHIVARTVTANGQRYDGDTGNFVHTLRAEGFDASEDGTGRGTPIVPIGEPASRAARDRLRPPADGRRRQTGPGLPGSQDRLHGASADPDGVRAPAGLPGRVEHPGGTIVDLPPDGPRYAAMGNAVTVPVAEWIGRRIVTWEAGQ